MKGAREHKTERRTSSSMWRLICNHPEKYTSFVTHLPFATIGQIRNELRRIKFNALIERQFKVKINSVTVGAKLIIKKLQWGIFCSYKKIIN